MRGSLNEMLEIKKANKKLGLDPVVLVSPFFNNGVYSKSILCYGNIKIAKVSTALNYGNILPEKMEVGFTFGHFNRINFLFHLSIQFPNMGSIHKTS